MNNFVLIWGTDTNFKQLLPGVTQGNDLIFDILNLPAGYNQLDWSWKNTVQPDLSLNEEWNTTAIVQTDTSLTNGTSVVFNIDWDDNNVLTRTARVTVPLVYPDTRDTKFELDKTYSFIYVQGTNNIQILFTINDINELGTSGSLPIPILKQQDRLFITIGQNDTSANYNTQDYANDTACFQEALNSSENLVIFIKNSNPVNGFTTYELETVALTTVKRLVLFSDGNVIIKQKAGTNQNMFNNYDYTQQTYTFNFLDYFETYNIIYDRNSDNQTIKNFTIFNFNCDTTGFPLVFGKGPTGHGKFYFHNIELNNNGWNDFESQALGSGQSPIHIRSAEEVTIEKVKGNNNDALFALSRISKITVKDIVTKNFYFDSIYIVLSKNVYIENVLASGEGTGFGIYNCQDVTVKDVLIKPILYTVQSVISNTEFTANLPSNDDNRYGGARTTFNGSYNRKMAVYWVSGNNANKLSASVDYVGSTKKITLVTSTAGNIQAGDTFYIGAREVHLDSEVGVNLDSENINLENISSFYPCKVDTNGNPFNAGALLIGDDVTNCLAKNITIVNPFSYGLETASSEAVLENITVKNAGLSGIIARTTCYLSGVIKTTNNGFRNQSGDTDGLRLVDSPRTIIDCIISKGNVGFGIRSFGTSDYIVVNSGDLQGNTTGTYTLAGTNNKISSQVI